MPSHNRSLFADFCKKRGQTSIVLELGHDSVTRYTTTKDVTVTDTSEAAKALINTYYLYTWNRSDN